MDRKDLDRLELKIDKQDERIDVVNTSLTEIKVDLREHMRRTVAAEEANILTKEALEVHKFESLERLQKLENKNENWTYAGWAAMGVLSALEMLNKLGIGIHF